MPSAAEIRIEDHRPFVATGGLPADLPVRRRLLSLALASVIASEGGAHMPDEAVFRAMTLPAMIASASDRSLDRTQREDVERYLESLGSNLQETQDRGAAIQDLHDETCLALKPSLICMRWPGKIS
ncbi:hypothetical protein [Methylobacterium fujisawaense]|jgi:hypothetical protein